MIRRCYDHHHVFARLRRQRCAARCLMVAGVAAALGALGYFVVARDNYGAVLVSQILGWGGVFAGNEWWCRVWRRHQRNDGNALNCRECS